MAKNKNIKRPQKQNPIGPIDTPKNTKLPAGLANDTRVVYAEEHNRNDG